MRSVEHNYVTWATWNLCGENIFAKSFENVVSLMACSFDAKLIELRLKNREDQVPITEASNINTCQVRLSSSTGPSLPSTSRRLPFPRSEPPSSQRPTPPSRPVHRPTASVYYSSAPLQGFGVSRVRISVRTILGNRVSLAEYTLNFMFFTLVSSVAFNISPVISSYLIAS